MGNSGKDLTKGGMYAQFIKLTLPLVLGYFLFMGYSVINTIWVGKILGTDAVGVTAIGTSISYVLISICTGGTLSANVLISQNYGSDKKEEINKIVGNSFSAGIILSVSVTVLAVLNIDSVLKLMNTPQGLFPAASSYMKITLLGFAFIYIFFLIVAVLRGIGDTMTSAYCLMVSTAVNAVLDPCLIKGIGPFPALGLDGAAYASVISQALAVVLGIVFIGFKNSVLMPKPGNMVFDRKILGQTLKIGIPALVQQIALSLGIMVMATFVNYFGVKAISAYGAVMRIDTIMVVIAMSLGAAVTTITGQNFGAGNINRIKEAFKVGMILALAASCIVAALALGIPQILIRPFVSETEVVGIAIAYLRIGAIGYVLYTLAFIPIGILNGVGKTQISTIVTLITMWVIRIPLACLLSKGLLGIKGIWFAIVICNLCSMIISLIYYKFGKWRTNESTVHKMQITG